MADITDPTEVEEPNALLVKLLATFKQRPSIPKINLADDIDEFGFSKQEKASLSNMWAYLKPYRRLHTINFFIQFYAANDYLVQKYRTTDGAINSEAFYKHAHIIFSMYRIIIEEGFKDPLLLNSLLHNVRERHDQCQVTRTDIILIGESLNYYLLNILEKFKTGSLLKALEKLTLLIAKSHADVGNPVEEKEIKSLRLKLGRSESLLFGEERRSVPAPVPVEDEESQKSSDKASSEKSNDND